MKRHRGIAPAACAAVSLGLSALPVHAASDGDLALFGRDPGKDKVYACFTRQYDAAHLAGHPKQNVTGMALLVDSYEDDSGRQYQLEVGVRFRKQPTLFQLSGACERTVDGKTALSCGFDCDGGHIDVRVKDAQSILVSIPDGARAWDPSSSEEPPAGAKFGTDDKLFRLDRANLHDCLPEALDDDTKAAIAGAK
jgi:hypothetical protein